MQNEDGKVGDECVQYVRLSSSAHNVLALSMATGVFGSSKR